MYSVSSLAAGASNGDVTGPMWLLLSAVALLIVLTAFFVGSEFAVVKVRMSRLDQLVSEGNKTAVLAKKIATDLDYYLSACQLGITVTALGLGFLGEPSVVRLISPILNEFNIPASVASALSFVIAFALVTFLHVVIGELAPKTLAIQYAERITLLFARPLYIFGKVMFPFIWLLNGSARVLLNVFGVKPAGHEQAHSEEELKIIMTQSFQSGEINQTELAMVQNIFSFDQHVTKDLMVPRTKMVTLSTDATKEEILDCFDENQYTRYPITDSGDKDQIVGYINVKEVLIDYANGRSHAITHYVKELPVVYETTALEETLSKMKVSRTHMALVVDEYGGTAGIITLEDLLEEIVGDIRDEFDADEVDEIRQMNPHEYLIDGRVLLSDIQERFGVEFEESEDIDTIGGWVQVQNTDIEAGHLIDTEKFTLEVVEIEQYHVEQVRFTLKTEHSLPDMENGE